MNRIYVVGAGVAGQEGFSRQALELINSADLLIGGERQLALFPEFKGQTLPVGSNLPEVIEALNNRTGRTVVLASGDPLFFGIGRYLLRNLPEEEFEFIPNVSSVQYAFAKIRQPWDDAVFVSTHGRPLKAAVDRIVANDKAAVLTDERNDPAAIARELIERGREGYACWLCENLGGDDERIVETDVRGLLEIEAAPLNVLILVKQFEGEGRDRRSWLGIPDDEFATVKKLITKQEVRVITLAKLQLCRDMILWDIGAGSGSVSIEADHLLPEGKIFAIERNPECRDFIRQNLQTFQTRNVTLVEGNAPECLDDLPDPDRVFIGGSGGNLWEILEVADRRLPPDGRIVLNAITLDTLTAANEFFANAGYQVEVTTVNIARTRPLTEYKMFEAFNPVYILAAVKE